MSHTAGTAAKDVAIILQEFLSEKISSSQATDKILARFLAGGEPFGVPAHGDAIAPWHCWFAWHPVETYDRGWKWLHFVDRQRYVTKPHLPGPLSKWWFYRASKSGSDQS